MYHRHPLNVTNFKKLIDKKYRVTKLYCIEQLAFSASVCIEI